MAECSPFLLFCLVWQKLRSWLRASCCWHVFLLQACQLGSLLKEAERRREDLQGELSTQVLEVERSKADMEELLQHNARLQKDSEEHQALKGAYNALLNRSEADRLELGTDLSKSVYLQVMTSVKNIKFSSLKCTFPDGLNLKWPD